LSKALGREMSVQEFHSKKILDFLHHNLIWLILFSYILAITSPGLGLWVRTASLGSINLSLLHLDLSLPSTLLAILLFNAGLGVRIGELKSLQNQIKILLIGVLSNVLGPLIFIVVVSRLVNIWHNLEETQQILTGLAIVASMPIAGASTAWAQNSQGNLSISLGLVLLTTLLSPLVTPVVLHAVGYATIGDYSEDLHELAQGTAISFLGAWVIFPSLLGILTNLALKADVSAKILPYAKIINLFVLVLLNYSNASISLPEIKTNPDWDFLFLSMIVVSLLCGLMFFLGYYISNIYKLARAEKVSLMFALGMNNNGSGLVLASMALSDHPRVMLPLIIYTLIQHLFAAYVDRALSIR
jgi:BASS family bile acid:Na+ symporter